MSDKDKDQDFAVKDKLQDKDMSDKDKDKEQDHDLFSGKDQDVLIVKDLIRTSANVNQTIQIERMHMKHDNEKKYSIIIQQSSIFSGILHIFIIK